MGHRLVLLLAGLGVVALGLARRRLQAMSARDAGWRRAIAVALIVNEVIEWGLEAAQGTARVPFQLCDVAVFLTAWVLLAIPPNGSVVSELAYFWGMAGSLQAIATPDLRQGFPDYAWIKFFLTHCGVVLSVTYLALTGRVRVGPQTVWRVWGLTNLYAVVAAGIIGDLARTMAISPTSPCSRACSIIVVRGPMIFSPWKGSLCCHSSCIARP